MRDSACAPCDSQLLQRCKPQHGKGSIYVVPHNPHRARQTTQHVAHNRVLACTGRNGSGCSSMQSPGRSGEHISSKSEQARRIRMECKPLRMKQLSQPSVNGSMRQSRRSAQKQGTGSIRLARTKRAFPRVSCSLPSSPARKAKDRP
jgi:hypothetical protein